MANHFYPRSPCGERLDKRCQFNGDNGFLSTLSLRRATKNINRGAYHIKRFLSTLSLRRATNTSIAGRTISKDFYPRSPCGERPPNRHPCRRSRNFYPRSPCGERPHPIGILVGVVEISIHALLAESDAYPDMIICTNVISIHALLAESDTMGVTVLGVQHHFYPRSPCGERRCNQSIIRQTNNFYPRSPCGERPPRVFRHCTTYLFLSTLSLRRATAKLYYLAVLFYISIHALLAESDTRRTYQQGEKRAFLSTLSLRRATPFSRFLICGSNNFYPRSPCGERQVGQKRLRQKLAISIHALLAESDACLLACFVGCFYFYPRSPCGERQFQKPHQVRHMQFLSTLSLRRATTT